MIGAQRVDIRKGLVDKELGSRLTDLETLQQMISYLLSAVSP